MKQVLFSVVWLVVTMLGASAALAEAPIVRSVTATSVHVEILLSAPVTPRLVTLPGDSQSQRPDRCYVDFSPASLGSQVRPLLAINTGVVRRIRASQFGPTTARVVLDLSSAQTCLLDVLTDPDRIRIVVSGGGSDKAAVPRTSGTPNPTTSLVTPAAPQTEPAKTSDSPRGEERVPTQQSTAPTVSPAGSAQASSVPRPQEEPKAGNVQELAAPPGARKVPAEQPPAGAPAAGVTAADDTAARALTLEEAYHLAQANEERVKIAASDLTKAHLMPWRALTQLSPRGDILGSYIRNKDEIAFIRPGTTPGDAFGGTVSTIRPLETWQGVLTLTQPLLQPAFPPSWKLGKDSIRQNEQQYDFTVREVLFGVAQAYYNVLRSQAQVVVAQDTSKLVRDELRYAQVRFRVGEVTKTDVLRAEVAVARAERELVSARNGLQLDRAVLARTIGVQESLRVVEPAPPSHLGKGYEDLLAIAYKQRQDLRAQQWAIDIARQRKNQVLARYFPQVSTQWQFPRVNPETFAFRDEFWTLTLNFQVPLFDGGVRELDLQEQNENLHQAQLQYDRLLKEIGLQVREALLILETLETTLETLKQEVKLAQENYDITSKQYRVGWSTSLDVNTSLNALNQARTQLANQTYAYQVAALGVERAIGLFAQDYLPQR